MGEDMKKKFKLPAWATYVLLGLEIALMIGLVVIAFLIMKASSEGGGTGLIKWFITNTVWFFMLIVFPLIVLFLLNIYLLIKTMNENTNKDFQAMSKEELLEEARRQAREELEKELAKLKDEKTE
ncbi:MAG: hypothetical protein RBS24_04180 [Bacilli bacterium]|nr:hypothetical protein [Bacilli bacterium]